MTELTSIHWDHVLALQASKDPFKVAVLQPTGVLIADGVLGPRFDQGDVEQAHERSKRFLEYAYSSHAELILAPEYSTPRSIVSSILGNGGDLLRDGALYVLPMNSMTLEDFDEIAQLQAPGVDLKMGGVARNSAKPSVNPCAILTKNGSTIHAVFQAKVMPAALEETSMDSGTEVFIIEGVHLCLAVATCADLNDADIHSLWCDALSRKSGGILCHPQWNPAPDFQAYEVFWRAALGHQDGAKRMVFALNWASGSTIQTGSQSVSVEMARSKVLRGRKLWLSPTTLRQLSHAGMNAHHWAPASGSKNRFEIWHAKDSGDTVWIWDFVRPFTNQTQATEPRQQGLQNAVVQRWDSNGHSDNSFDSSELTGAFWTAASLTELNPQICPGLENVSPWDIDRFCSSCRMEKEEEWLEVDPTERPSSPLDCSATECAKCKHNGRHCSRGRKHRYETIAYSSACIRSFVDYSQKEPNGLSIGQVESYPINLSNLDGRPAGWLCHGRGRSARDIERDASGLIGPKLSSSELPIRMFVFQVDGKVDTSRIGEMHIDAEGESSQDILNPEHGREVIVTHLENGASCD